MPFCPHCKMEYREGFDWCPDCGERLVAQLPEDSSPAHDTKNNPFVWLQNVEDGPLGESSLAMLRAYDVPYKTAYRDSGMIAGLYTGKSLTGLDVFVPQSQLAYATELIRETGLDLRDFIQYQLIPVGDEYEDEMNDIIAYYKEKSDVLWDDFTESLKTRFVILSEEQVVCLVQIADSGRLWILPDSEYITGDIFDAAITLSIDYARECARDQLFTKLPRNEACFVAQFLKHGFVGKDLGEIQTVAGKQVECIYLSYHLQEMTK